MEVESNPGFWVNHTIVAKAKTNMAISSKAIAVMLNRLTLKLVSTNQPAKRTHLMKMFKPIVFRFCLFSSDFLMHRLQRVPEANLHPLFPFPDILF